MADGTVPPSRRRRLLVAAGTVLCLLIAVGVVVQRSSPEPSDGDPSSSVSQEPLSIAPAPSPADMLLAPGYGVAPGPFTLPAASAGQTPRTATLTSRDAAVGTAGLVGLSFEATDLASPVWGSEDSNVDEALGALDQPVLRFGGNSVDRRMWWTSTGEPAPDWAEATVTPEDLDRVAGAAQEADASVTLVLDLGHDDPARAADMAAHARQAFGERLLAVSIGNEPNGFRHPNQPQLAVRDEGWGPQAYQTSLQEYSAALQDRTPGMPIAGPGAYSAPWWRAFAGSGIPDQRALSLHWYPLYDCEGPDSSPANPTVEDLTSPGLRDRAERIIGPGAEVAAQNNLPLWIEETGPTSCPGTNDTSRTHAQALWTVDYSLTAAELGASRIAFHSTLAACRGGAPMSPVCGIGDYGAPGEILAGRTSYLSLLQLGQIPAGRVLQPSTSGDGRVSVHGVLAEDGTLSIIVVDLRDPASARGVAAVDVAAPATGNRGGWVPVQGSRLEGTSLDAQSSTLGALSPVDEQLGARVLEDGRPLRVTTMPATSTVIVLEPRQEAAASDGGS